MRDERQELGLDRTLPSSDGRTPLPPDDVAAPGHELALARTRTPDLDRTRTPPPDFYDEVHPASPRSAAQGFAADSIDSPRFAPTMLSHLGDGDGDGVGRPLAPHEEDRRARALLKARLFPRKSGPVKIGRFTILDRLGEGGMGVVYTAYDDQLDRKIAVKVLRGEATRRDEVGRTRLLREAQAMARLSHPNIVTVHEVGALDDQIFIAMEFVRGLSLDAWLKAQARPWRAVLGTFLEAGRGLEAAHRAGIVHRDFKPHNVLVGADDRVVKVLDFGLARASEHAGSEELSATPESGAYNQEGGSMLEAPLTRTGAIMGTPAYMAPEQHEGRIATAQSDQFSFCVSLHEGLYGVHPFDCSTLVSLIASVSTGQVLEPRGSHKVPTWLRRVLMRGLAVEPGRRYPSMAALLADLGRDPAVARRRWLTTAALASIVGSAGFGAAALLPAATPVCQDIAAELADVWDEDRAADVERGLLATQVAYAADTWSRVRPGLDDYAKTWLAMRAEACETHHAGRQSDLLFDLRTACLDQRRASLGALVGVLESADTTAVEKAVTAVAGLPPLATCADTDALTQAVPPPEDPAIRARVQTHRETLASAKSFEDAGHYDRGLAMVTPVVTESETLEYKPLLAEALLRQGSIEMQSGRHTEADASLGRALWTAIASKHDDVAALAASKRMFVQAQHLRRPSEVLADVPLSQALADRVDDPGVRGEQLNNLGVVYAMAGDYAAADRTLRSALQVKQETLVTGSPEVAYTLANLALVATSSARHEDAAAHLEAASTMIAAALGEHHPQTRSMRHNLALALRSTGKLEAAEAMLGQLVADDAALARLEDLQVMITLADLEMDRRELPAAQSHYQRALAGLEKRDDADALVFQALHGLGDVAAARGDVDAALALHLRGIDANERNFGRNHPSTAYSEWRTGGMLLRAGRAADALVHLNASLVLREATLPPDSPLLADSLELIGRAQARLGHLAEATAATQRALALREAALPPESPDIALSLAAVAEVLQQERRDADAVPLLRRAVNIYRHASDADLPELALTRFALAKVLRATGSAAEAKQLATAARDVLRTRGPAFKPEAETIDTWLASAAVQP